MTLSNLVGIGLEAIPTDTLTIKKLLAAAERNLRDAAILQLSNENRFDTAYKAIMQMANLALQVEGFRTLTSKPGHHQMMIQSDYSGDLVADSAVAACIYPSYFKLLGCWLPLLTPVTYLSKLLGLRSVAAYKQLELFWV